MKILLINTSPVVSRLFKLCADENDKIVLTELDGLDIIEDDNFDIIFVDEASYGQEDFTFLSQLNIAKKIYISYIDEVISGFDGVIRKPFLPAQITQMLDNIEADSSSDTRESTQEEDSREHLELITLDAPQKESSVNPTEDNFTHHDMLELNIEESPDKDNIILDLDDDSEHSILSSIYDDIEEVDTQKVLLDTKDASEENILLAIEDENKKTEACDMDTDLSNQHNEEDEIEKEDKTEEEEESEFNTLLGLQDEELAEEFDEVSDEDLSALNGGEFGEVSDEEIAEVLSVNAEELAEMFDKVSFDEVSDEASEDDKHLGDSLADMNDIEEETPFEVLDSNEIDKIKALLDAEDEIDDLTDELDNEEEYEDKKIKVIKEKLISDGLEIIEEDEIVDNLDFDKEVVLNIEDEEPKEKPTKDNSKKKNKKKTTVKDEIEDNLDFDKEVVLNIEDEEPKEKPTKEKPTKDNSQKKKKKKTTEKEEDSALNLSTKKKKRKKTTEKKVRFDGDAEPIEIIAKEKQQPVQKKSKKVEEKTTKEKSKKIEEIKKDTKKKSQKEKVSKEKVSKKEDEKSIFSKNELKSVKDAISIAIDNLKKKKIKKLLKGKKLDIVLDLHQPAKNSKKRAVSKKEYKEIEDTIFAKLSGLKNKKIKKFLKGKKLEITIVLQKED